MKRLDRYASQVLSVCIGACPSCAVFATAFDNGHSVIYRRSSNSVTMRCEDCGLQWTMTWAKVNAAMHRHLATDLDERSAHVYEQMAEMTAGSIPVRLTPVADRDKALKNHLARRADQQEDDR